MAMMTQTAAKVEVEEEGHGVELCNQQPDRMQPWHKGSQAA